MIAHLEGHPLNSITSHCLAENIPIVNMAASIFSSNPTLASGPNYSFSQAANNAAAGVKEHSFYP